VILLLTSGGFFLDSFFLHLEHFGFFFFSLYYTR